MDLGLKLILGVGLALNLILGYLIAWLVAKRYMKKGFPRAVTVLLLGAVVSVLSYALTIVVIWPPLF